MKNKQQHIVIEHYLVPAGLFLLNICLIHLVYVFATDGWQREWYTAALTVSFLMLSTSLLAKRKGYLFLSIAFYLVLLLVLV
ncbi:hypothetical protein [Parapedobacter lycopersici]|uniref:hypothetical protein n=1 Tax=Parapedobacter lycopersici TaxID=1864939 RepID=UPI00214D1CDC|nr:hypothetical protein [Parapedobacter lycopersici]